MLHYSKNMFSQNFKNMALSPPPADASRVLETVEYLKACNAIFERGILGKGVYIKDSDSPILTSMKTGYKYYTQWLDRKLLTGMCVSPKNCFDVHSSV